MLSSPLSKPEISPMRTRPTEAAIKQVCFIVFALDTDKLFRSSFSSSDSPSQLATNSTRRRSLYALPRAHQALLRDIGSILPSPVLETGSIRSSSAPSTSSSTSNSSQPPLRGFAARLDEVDDRIRRNADVLNEIVQDSRGFLGDGETTKVEVEEKEELNRGRVPNQAADSSPEEGISSEDNSSGASSSKIKSKSTSRSRTSQSKEGSNSSSGTSKGEDSTTANINSNSDSSKSDKSARHEARNMARERLKKAQRADHGVDKIRSTLKQLVRDWSEDGTLEREAAYGPILSAIDDRFGSIPENERSMVRCLVPGAGLGRLAWELAFRGFSAQGNEFSFYMLLASHFVLNKTQKIAEHVIYPFIHSSSNFRNANDMLKPVAFPDVRPSGLPHQVDFSMVAGEVSSRMRYCFYWDQVSLTYPPLPFQNVLPSQFIEVYSSPSESSRWDVVATCYFIDTARNFLRYLEVFNHVLPLGGLWINVGPLLWHYEGGRGGSGSDSGKDGKKKKTLGEDISIELTLEEVIDLIKRMGFEIVEERSLPRQPYTGNPSGMLTYQYQPEFWVARKVAHCGISGDA